MFIVGRMKEGSDKIDYLIGYDNKLATFESKEKATEFLLRYGFGQDDIESFVFEQCNGKVDCINN